MPSTAALKATCGLVYDSFTITAGMPTALSKLAAVHSGKFNLKGGREVEQGTSCRDQQ